MCGIVGIASTKPQAQREWLNFGRDKIFHRGPDDAGSWWSQDGKVGLAHRRLSIIDLSNGGHQPMKYASNDLVIVFNGEIYNYVELKKTLIQFGYIFKTKSDTEIILAAYDKWGKECLEKFIGMFAFAIYDKSNNGVFLARDRAGEKPLFYHLENGNLYFGSELKSLLVRNEFNRKVNQSALMDYLGMGYVSGEKCLIDGFKKLSPGSAIFFNLDNGNFKKWRYWELPEPTYYNKPADQEELQEEFENLFEKAIKRQMISDVPLGVLLSGGFDSSLITAIAAKNDSNVKTFTIGFPQDKNLDETKHAELVAKYFGTDHTTLDVKEINTEIISDLVKYYDEPIADSSLLPTYILSNLVRKHCKVALGGDGGDELFGGYKDYSNMISITNNFSLFPNKLMNLISCTGLNYLPIGFRGRNWLKNLGWSYENSLPSYFKYFDVVSINKIFNDDFWDINVEENTYKDSKYDLIQRATRRDFHNYLPDDILVKVDRSSMANSLEIRAPFLDHKIIEFAFSRVPSNLKTDSKNKKIFLKTLAKKILPKEFDISRKQGFSIPLRLLLKDSKFRDFFEHTLLNSSSPFNKNFVRKIIHGQDIGRNNQNILFALLMLELWRKEYDISF